MRRLSLGLALLAIASGVNGSASAQTSGVIADSDSNAVYALLLPSDTPVALLEETRQTPACPSSNPLLAFSAVGFNADRTLAMVAVQQNCGGPMNGRGGSCEGGYTTLLQKGQNGWHSAQVTPSPLRCAWAS